MRLKRSANHLAFVRVALLLVYDLGTALYCRCIVVASCCCTVTRFRNQFISSVCVIDTLCVTVLVDRFSTNFTCVPNYKLYLCLDYITSQLLYATKMSDAREHLQ